MIRRPPRSTRTDTLFPYTTLFRSPNRNPATIIDTPVAVKFNNVSPMATIDHRWSSSIMTYATFSKGVKGGGFQQRVIVPRILQPTFGPEKLNAYELGAKPHFFDRRLPLDVAAFQNTEERRHGKEGVMTMRSQWKP